MNSSITGRIAAEQHGQEVVGVAIVAGPAHQHRPVAVLLLAGLEIFGPFMGDDLGRHAHLGEIRLGQLGHAARRIGLPRPPIPPRRPRLRSVPRSSLAGRVRRRHAQRHRRSGSRVAAAHHRGDVRIGVNADPARRFIAAAAIQAGKFVPYVGYASEKYAVHSSAASRWSTLTSWRTRPDRQCRVSAAASAAAAMLACAARRLRTRRAARWRSPSYAHAARRHSADRSQTKAPLRACRAALLLCSASIG